MPGSGAAAPLISVVVPAYNEADLLPETLPAILSALGEGLSGRSAGWELIVADNASTDATAAIAAAHGARVVHEPHRQIARARNAGAAAASGDWILFIDADCWPSAALIAHTAACMRRDDVVGGGSTVRMDGLSVALDFVCAGWNRLSRTLGWAAGSYLFCRTPAFAAVGGFSASLYAGEEIDLSRRLKRWGARHGQRFVILARHPLLTSSRKARLYSAPELASAALGMVRHPRRFFRDRQACWPWYDGRR